MMMAKKLLVLLGLSVALLVGACAPETEGEGPEDPKTEDVEKDKEAHGAEEKEAEKEAEKEE